MAQTLREIFGQQVRLERVMRRWSQEALGLGAGIDRSHIGAIERAEVGASIDTIEKVAAALDIDICQLLKSEHVLHCPGRRSATEKIIKSG